MADNKLVRFGRGPKTMAEFQESVTGWKDMIYFNTTTSEIYVGEKKYGFSEDDKALLGNGGIRNASFDVTNSKLIIELNAIDTKDGDNITYKTVSVDLPVANSKTPGLMTEAQVTALGEAAAAVLRLEGEGEGSVKKAQAEAEAYALGLVEALDLAEVKGAGQAIVSISQVDGKVEAVAGDVAAAHVTVATDKIAADNVENALVEIVDKIATFDTPSVVEEKIENAIKNLDSDVKDESNAHVKVAISQVDGKLSSVVITEDNIADKSVVDSLVTSVGTSGDVAKADGSVYARIAALVAEDSNLDGRLDVIEGEGEGSVKKALADAKTYVNEEIAKLDAEVTSDDSTKFSVKVVEVDGKITDVVVADLDVASADALSQLSTKVNAFLDAEGLADKTLDTLKEIQDFINTEAGAADQMLLDIAANKTAIEKEVTDRQNAINGLNSEKTGEGTFVDVTVKQEAGVITSITVNESDIASANALKNLSDSVGTSADGKEANTVFGKIAAEADARVNAVNDLSGKMGEPVNGTLAQDIADAKQATADLAAGDVTDNKNALLLLNNDVNTEGSVKHTAKGYADSAQAAAEATAKTYTDDALTWYEG